MGFVTTCHHRLNIPRQFCFDLVEFTSYQVFLGEGKVYKKTNAMKNNSANYFKLNQFLLIFQFFYFLFCFFIFHNCFGLRFCLFFVDLILFIFCLKSFIFCLLKNISKNTTMLSANFRRILLITKIVYRNTYVSYETHVFL